MANQTILARGQRSRLADLGLGAQPFTISLSMQSGVSGWLKKVM